MNNENDTIFLQEMECNDDSYIDADSHVFVTHEALDWIIRPPMFGEAKLITEQGNKAVKVAVVNLQCCRVRFIQFDNEECYMPVIDIDHHTSGKIVDSIKCNSDSIIAEAEKLIHSSKSGAVLRQSEETIH